MPLRIAKYQTQIIESVIKNIKYIKNLTREMLSENMNKINEEIQESSEFYTNDDIMELNKVVEVLVETFFN